MMPLETRTYRFKNPQIKFFCPLCRSEREITVKPKLNSKHYLKISIITLVFSLITFQWLGVVSFSSFFVFLALFEVGVKIRFKKELPCPYCGFDASWYKKNVVVAREKVKQFWDEKKNLTTEA